MKSVALCALLVLGLAGGEVHADKKALSKYGSLYQGLEVTVEMARFTKKNASGLKDALLKIRGAPAEDAGIDGIVLRYEAVHAGRGFDLRIREGKSWSHRISCRPSYYRGSQRCTLNLGRESYPIAYERKASKTVKPLILLRDFNASTKSNKKK